LSELGGFISQKIVRYTCHRKEEEEEEEEEEDDDDDDDDDEDEEEEQTNRNISGKQMLSPSWKIEV
jgi:hypothetical protein